MATAWTVTVNASTLGTDMTAVSTTLDARIIATATDGAAMALVNAIQIGAATTAATTMLARARTIATVTAGATTVSVNVTGVGLVTTAA